MLPRLSPARSKAILLLRLLALLRPQRHPSPRVWLIRQSLSLRAKLSKRLSPIRLSPSLRVKLSKRLSPIRHTLIRQSLNLRARPSRRLSPRRHPLTRQSPQRDTNPRQRIAYLTPLLSLAASPKENIQEKISVLLLLISLRMPMRPE